MSASDLAPAAAGLGVGIALAAAPGPVQAVLLTEAVRGGVRRGFQALAGVHLTFGIMLFSLALGLSVAAPKGLALRALKVAGGMLLLWLAVDGVRSKGPEPGVSERRRLPPVVRGSLAIVLNPGGWLFLGAVASPLFVTASERGGTGAALVAAAALAAGTAAGDAGFVVIGGVGLRRAGERVTRAVRLVLAGILAALGAWLLLSGAIP